MATTTAKNLDSSIKILAQPSDPNPTAEIESPPASAPSEEEIKVAEPAPDGGAGEVTDTQKKMKRAERFGMPVKLSENEKRSSRAERFGTTTSVQGSDALKKAEEEKRKARAERFGLVQSDTTNQEAKKKARLDRFTPPTKIDPVEEDKKKARAIRFSKSQSGSQPQANGKGKIEEETVVVNNAGEAT